MQQLAKDNLERNMRRTLSLANLMNDRDVREQAVCTVLSIVHAYNYAPIVDIELVCHQVL